MSVSAAKSRVTQAKMQLESNRIDEAESALAQGFKFLEGLPDAETAEVRAALVVIQTQIANMPKPEDVRAMTAARGKLKVAQGHYAENNLYSIADTLKSAESMIANVPQVQKAELLAEIIALRVKVLGPQAAPPPPPVPAAPLPGYVAAPAPPAPAPPPPPAPAYVAPPTPAAPAWTPPPPPPGWDLPLPPPVIAAPPPPAAAAWAPPPMPLAPPAPPVPPPPAPAAPSMWAPMTPIATPVSAPPPPAPAVSADGLTDEDRANVARARSRITQAKMLFESRRFDHIDNVLEQGLDFLVDVPATASAPIQAEVAAMRAQVDRELRADAVRAVTEELDRHLRDAESSLAFNRYQARVASEHVTKRIGETDVQAMIGDGAIAAYRAKLADFATRLAAAIKAEAVENALPLLVELEGHVAADPFAGKPQHEVYRESTELERLKSRIRGHIKNVPDGDPEIAALEVRVAAVDEKVRAADLAWGKASLESTVQNTWASVYVAIVGWERETDTSLRSLESPTLAKTRLAIQRIRYLLLDPATQQLRNENLNDAKISDTFKLAEHVLNDAATKLDAAFNVVLAAAERVETPMSTFDLDRPSLLAHEIDQTLGGTRFAAPTAARARALDARWRAEVNAIMKQRQGLCDHLTREAERAWPAIRDASSCVPFDHATAEAGQVVLLEGVYNRSGWDYADRAFDFAVKVGATVVAGAFESHVLAALEHVWYELKLQVGTRIPWDVIAVVEGPGKIGERTEVLLRDKFTSAELGRLEQWPMIDCLTVRIVGLHAGPVAVAPT